MDTIKRRNRQQTKYRLLQAAGVVIAKVGVDKAGINTISAQAVVNKVLIYRYFGGWNGLIEALYEKILLEVKTQSDVTQPKANVSTSSISSKAYAIGYYRTFKSNVTFQQLLRWQMDNQQTELAQRLASLQQEAINQIEVPESSLQSVVLHLLLAGINHLVLMDNQPGGRDRNQLIEQAIQHLYD